MTRFAVAALVLVLTAAPVAAQPPVGRDEPAAAARDAMPKVGQGDDAPLVVAAPSGAWPSTPLVAGTAVVVLAGLAWTARRRASRRPGRHGWLGRLVPEPAGPADRIDVLSRRGLGPRESLVVVKVGDDRFLLGATAGSVSLLTRLSGREPAVPAPALAPARDFALELAHHAEVERDAAPAEDALRSAVARARARLSRLSPGEPATDERRA